MNTLYSISIQLYGLIIRLLAFFGNKKAGLWHSGRKNWKLQLDQTNPADKKIIWIHAASLGEFEQVRSLINQLQPHRSEIFLLLTFFSPSGYELRKSFEQVDKVMYLPLDTRKNSKVFIHRVKPDLVVFVKYEFWFNYLRSLKKNNVHTLLISGIFRPNQHFFKFYGNWFRKQLRAYNYFFLQNQTSKNLLKKIGLTNADVIGDTRFDRVVDISKDSFENKITNGIKLQDKVVVFGSSWSKEQELALQFHQRFKSFKLIIAPHEIDKNDILSLKNKFGKDCTLYSEYQSGEEFKILIIDKIGLLSKIYRLASFSVIGGGFGSGIHNLAEAAIYGSPVFFGPNHHKFQEAKDLIKVGGGFCIANFNELKSYTESFLKNPELLSKASTNAQHYILENSGATQHIYNYILQLLSLKKKSQANQNFTL